MSGIINILIVFMAFSFFATGLECYLLYGKKDNIFKVIMTAICAIATVALCFIHLNETLDNLDKKSYEENRKDSVPESYLWPKEIFLKKLKATYYQAKKGQCDSDPFTTSTGYKIDPKRLRKGELKIVAVSRDLLSVYPYGSTIYVHYPVHLRGTYRVEDTMNKRFKKRIDFLVHDKIKVDSVHIL